MSTETIEPLPIQTIDTISAVHSSGQREPVFAIQEVVDRKDPEGQHYFLLKGDGQVHGMIGVEDVESDAPHMHLEADVRDPKLLGCFVTSVVEKLGVRTAVIDPEQDTNGIPTSILTAAGFMGIVGTQNHRLAFHAN